VEERDVRSSRTAVFVLRQIVIVAGAVIAYFGVRGLTEGSVATAERNAQFVLDVERSLGLAVEHQLQRALIASDSVVTLANWVYIWMHWPVLIGTLIWLIVVDRDEYIALRNAMIISGLIGLVIFATFPVAPPRLYSPEFVDTVTERSHSYRVLQPPGFVNAYAAVPSLHFGWNLLVGIAWFRVGRSRWWRVAAVLMPAAMAWAVVATANHYVLDVVLGGLIALCGVVLERFRRQRTSSNRDRVDEKSGPQPRGGDAGSKGTGAHPVAAVDVELRRDGYGLGGEQDDSTT
jgi:hypothetical protein